MHQFHPTIPDEISHTRFESLPLLKADRFFFIVQHYLDKTSQLLKQNQIKTNVLKAAVSASICVLQHFNSTTIIKQKLNRSVLLNLLQTLIITTLYMAERILHGSKRNTANQMIYMNECRCISYSQFRYSDKIVKMKKNTSSIYLTLYTYTYYIYRC